MLIDKGGKDIFDSCLPCIYSAICMRPFQAGSTIFIQTKKTNNHQMSQLLEECAKNYITLTSKCCDHPPQTPLKQL